MDPSAPAPDADRAPIFIVGTGRSGSTLLRLMMCAHPRIYIAHEASFYVWEALGSKRRSAEEQLRAYFQTFSFRWLDIDPREVMAELELPLSRDELKLAYLAVMRVKAARYGRVRYGDKTPSHAAALGRIYEDFPDARVIHIVRDPRGTVLSLSHMPWASRSFYGNSVFVDIERAQVEKYRDRMLQVRLEDLLAEPRDTMQRVLEFVGEPWDDAVLDHASHIPDPNDMPPLPWLSTAARKRGTPRARWQDMSPRHIRAVERLTRKCMRAHGYERAELLDEPGRLAVLWAWMSSVPEAFRFWFHYARLGLHLRTPSNCDSDETKRLLERLNPEAWPRYPGLEIPDPPPLPAGWDEWDGGRS